ncbi:MAG: hypothetical protein WA823_10875 [Candidatus Acidiferrales bacterium]
MIDLHVAIISISSIVVTLMHQHEAVIMMDVTLRGASFRVVRASFLCASPAAIRYF